jgi:hypothetical protein
MPKRTAHAARNLTAHDARTRIAFIDHAWEFIPEEP